jgi:hypothetical protein
MVSTSRPMEHKDTSSLTLCSIFFASCGAAAACKKRIAVLLSPKAESYKAAHASPPCEEIGAAFAQVATTKVIERNIGELGDVKYLDNTNVLRESSFEIVLTEEGAALVPSLANTFAKYPKISLLSQNVLTKLKSLQWTDGLLLKLDKAIFDYPILSAELSSDLILLDHFKGLHTDWYYRLGLARGYKVTSGTGVINLPENFGKVLKDLDMFNGQTIGSIFSQEAAQVSSTLGTVLENKVGSILEEAFAEGSISGITNADIPTDLKNYYEGIYNQGYTKMSQQVKVRITPPGTVPIGSSPVPDLFFFKTNTDALGNVTIDLNNVIYHDVKIHVSTGYSSAQNVIKETIETAKTNNLNAEFYLFSNLEINGQNIVAGTKITIKEMSKVATEIVGNKVNLVRKVTVIN